MLLIHRPGYNDWSLPKGKLSADEYLPGCAVRETHEETGVRCSGSQRRWTGSATRLAGGTKTVSYWRASLIGEARVATELRDRSQVLWLPAPRRSSRSVTPTRSR